MATIESIATPLTHGVCLVDEADLALVADWNWWSQTAGDAVYVRGYRIGQWGAGSHSYLHRHLCGLGPWRETRLDVDHVNRNPLDNRRRNLRVVTRSRNLLNTVVRAGGSSRFRGVSLDRRSGKWKAYIKVNGRHRHLGLFAVEEEAARAYNVAALAAWDDAAPLNDIGGDSCSP
jgi:hypothetical protein